MVDSLNKLLLAGILCITTAGGLGTASAAEPDHEAVRAAIAKLVPAAESIIIADSPVSGLLQVTLDSDILYVSEDGKILVHGRLYDLATRQDLTDQARSVLRKAKIKDINRDGQIVFAPQDTQYELTVFTDIDCGYCRRLHSQMAEYNAEGISIRYMMFPRAGIGSHSYDKAVSVWCAEDSRSALTEAKAGSEPEPRQCDNPIKAQYEMGQIMGVTGTPALLTSDGQLIPGYVPPKQLKQRLDRLAAAAAGN